MVRKICNHKDAHNCEVIQLKRIETELSTRFTRGLYLPDEAHVNPREFLKRSYSYLQSANAIIHNQRIDTSDKQLDKFDYVIDCRGINSADRETDLRGVRGEAVVVDAPDVNLKRPIRIIHPRYSLYIIPREGKRYYLGATQLESSVRGPITVRSALELLSAAFSVHSGFGEARILECCTGLRPAFFDNEPKIKCRDNLISINGLYRHGFLLAPIISRFVGDFINQRPLKELAINIMEFGS